MGLSGGGLAFVPTATYVPEAGHETDEKEPRGSDGNLTDVHFDPPFLVATTGDGTSWAPVAIVPPIFASAELRAYE